VQKGKHGKEAWAKFLDIWNPRVVLGKGPWVLNPFSHLSGYSPVQGAQDFYPCSL
jgi:hypothetical protein